MHIKTADGQMIIIDQSDTFRVSFNTCKLDDNLLLKCLKEGAENSAKTSAASYCRQERLFCSANYS